MRNRLLRSEVDLAALLDLYQQVRAGKKVKDDETNPLVPVLRLSGVVNAPEGLLRVRNRVYDRVFDKDWVQSHMPDAEMRRQATAYRRGVARTGAIALGVILIMGLLAASAVLSARQAREKTVSPTKMRPALIGTRPAPTGMRQSAPRRNIRRNSARAGVPISPASAPARWRKRSSSGGSRRPTLHGRRRRPAAPPPKLWQPTGTPPQFWDRSSASSSRRLSPARA